MMIDTTLRIHVLGALAVERDGELLQLPPSKKTRALLAYLALTARPHRRDRLCAMFWAVPDDPRASLRWSLTHLRPLVDSQDRKRVIADRESVSLDLDGASVDLVTWRAALRGGVEELSTEKLREVAEALAGEVLEGLDLTDCQEFHNWCIALREEARALRVRVLTALVDRLSATPDDALPYARALSQLEPTSEAAQAAHLRMLRAAGRWREAEAEYRGAQRRLADFNVMPTGLLRDALQAPLRVAARPPAENRMRRLAAAARLLKQPSRHPVQFCRTADDVRIAYAQAGDGPPLVWAAHWLSHLSHSWESPIWRHWTEEFARDRAFIHYDERGNGLSDWENPEFSVDAFVRDLEAVVDSLGLERFDLIGSSKGGATAIAYAARHPERVSRLILLGTFAQGWRVRGDAAEIERREAIITLARQGWAQDNPAFRQIVTSLLMPDATLEEMQAFNDLQRISASAENAARLLRSSGVTNVLDLLPAVKAPTLVLHGRGDTSMPFAQGQLIASRIPNARFVPLDTRNHVLLPRDPAWAHFVREVREFLDDTVPAFTPAAAARRRFAPVPE